MWKMGLTKLYGEKYRQSHQNDQVSVTISYAEVSFGRLKNTQIDTFNFFTSFCRAAIKCSNVSINSMMDNNLRVYRRQGIDE